MTPQELKSSILQLAVQGRLVEQRPEEGTAEELYRQIQEEKQRLIKEGKIKKEKPLPEITEDEVPFDIPESWKWVRLKSICSKIVDGDHNPPSGNKNATEYMMLSAKNINNNRLVDLESARWLTKDIFIKENERTKIQLGDIFLTTVATLGRSCVFEKALNITFQRSVTVITTLAFNYYLKYAFDSAYIQNHMVKNASGTAQKGFYLNQTENLLIPFPPLAEQKRIVAKIEELLPYIDRYEKAWSKLEDFNKRFPGDMQKSVLQMAIQGKLVEQRPEEGTGEELFQQLLIERESLIICKRFKRKKLPELSSDDFPFDIPETWKWVRLGDIISIESGKGLTSSQMQEGNIPVYGGNGITGHHDTSLLHEETVVIGRVGFYCGSVHVTEKESWVTDNAFITTYPTRSINREYLVYVLKHMNLGQNNNATAQPVVSGKKIYPLPFPLPPLAEQKRIVQKLEEILPLCDKLK